jgi:hypothetical protein
MKNLKQWRDQGSERRRLFIMAAVIIASSRACPLPFPLRLRLLFPFLFLLFRGLVCPFPFPFPFHLSLLLPGQGRDKSNPSTLLSRRFWLSSSLSLSSNLTVTPSPIDTPGQDGRGSRINEGGASPCLKNISVTATATAQDENVSSAAKTCGMKEAIDEWTSGEKPVVEPGSPVEEACRIFCREENVRAYILGKEAGTEAVGKSMRGDLNVAYGGDLDLNGMGLSEEEESDYKKAFWLGHRAGAGIVLYPGPDIKKTGFMKTLKEAMKLAKTSNDPDLARRHQSIFELAPYLDEHLAKLLEMEVS